MKKILSLFLSVLMVVTTLVLPTTVNAKGNGQDSTNPVIDGFYADPDIDFLITNIGFSLPLMVAQANGGATQHSLLFLLRI